MNKYSKQMIKPAITHAVLFFAGVFVVSTYPSFLPGWIYLIIALLSYWSFWLMVRDIQYFLKDGKKMGLRFFAKEIGKLEADIRILEMTEALTDHEKRRKNEIE